MNNYRGNVVDVFNKRIVKAEVVVENGHIVSIIEDESIEENVYILPGLVDSHVHIESSMVLPSRFAFSAVKHGTVAVVSDPHEIANVLGVNGVEYMIRDANTVPFHFYFGAPSCVPATSFDNNGFSINTSESRDLLGKDYIYFLSEMMNFPGVIHGEKEVLDKILWAKKYKKPIDGHAPGLRGVELDKYISAGISTDHECTDIEEAREKIRKGMIVQIREGSAAKSFECLASLIDEFPDKVMLCSDDLHPDELVKGHINRLIKKGIEKNIDFFNLIRAASVNPIKHYNLSNGMLRVNDSADLIVVDSPEKMNVLKTVVKGECVYEYNKVNFSLKETIKPNNFRDINFSLADLLVKDEGRDVKIIKVSDGSLLTGCEYGKPRINMGSLISDTENDILKIVLVNRYKEIPPAVGFVKGFGLKRGGIISSIAHDNHNVLCVGTDDSVMIELIHWVNRYKGGIAFCDGQNIKGLPLPVAGIMSDENVDVVAEKYRNLDMLVKRAGSVLTAPFMALSFLSLLVIPSLKIGDNGLFDGLKFQYTNLYREK